jgi:UDP-N-acetylmuramoylalanine--D-glutamate ligase
MKRRVTAGKKFSGQHVLVVGLGVHGGAVAAVRWLVAHGATVRVTDKKTQRELRPSITALRGLSISWRLGREDIADVRWADWILQNPGVPATNALIVAARKHGKPIHNEAGIFLREVKSPIIGVTGTRGKTTTTLLIAHLLKKFHRGSRAAGNLRDVPMLSILDRIRDHEWTVLELSSFQLEGVAAVQTSPAIAVWTNMLVDHLNRYRTMAAYAEAKSQILRYQHPHDVAVLNADSAVVRSMARYTHGHILWFSTKRQQGDWSVILRDGWVEEWRGKKCTKIVQWKKFPLAGDHQQHNLLAAVGACRAAGVPVTTIRQALPSFPGVPHRQEIIRTWRGHQWVNDTAATSPDGAAAAIAAFPDAVYIVGGTDKSLDFTPLLRALHGHHGPIVCLPGTATTKLRRGLRQAKFRGQIVLVESMAEAVTAAAAAARPGQSIVLTPGAASFGLFRHEFDRGEQFIRAVKQLR